MKLDKFNLIFFITIVIISIILFSYVFYKSEIYASGANRDFYFKYYLISIISFFFSFVGFFIKKENLIKLTMIIFSSIFSFYLIELFLVMSNKIIDEKYQYIEEFKKNPPTLVPVIYYSDHNREKNIDKNIVPLAGISKIETIFCKEDGPLIRYKSDKFGFNNDDQVWKDKNIYAVTIGDSFTHGSCVDRDETIAKNIYKGKKVLNLGFGGTGPLVQYAIFKEYINEVNPKNIFWIYYEENDLGDLINELSNPTLKKYLEIKNYSQRLSLRQEQIDKKLFKVLNSALEKKNKITKKKLLEFFKLKRLRYLMIDSTTNKIIIPKELKKILKNVNEISKDKNINLYFVYLPEKNRFTNNLLNDLNYRQYGKIKELVKSLNIPIIDLNLEFQKRFQNPLILYNKNYFHLNVLGYKSVGNIISDKMGE